MNRIKTTLRAIVALIAPGLALRGIEPVSIAAGADQHYVVQKFGMAGNHTRPETYILAKGSCFDLRKDEKSLDASNFMAIAREMAPDLARQNYLPSLQAKDADLLIVVHWGITAVEDDSTNGQADMDQLLGDLQSYNSGLQKASIKDPGYVNSDLSILGAKSGAAGRSLEDNAQLTGYTDAFHRAEYESLGLANGMSDKDRQMRADLMSERYFIILMAYDYRSLREAKRSGQKPKLLWSTHVSISAIGRNFSEALPAMSHAASPYFGHQEDDLLLNVRNIPTGKVDVGSPRPVEDHKGE